MNPHSNSIDRRAATESTQSAHADARLALGYSGQTGQRVRGTCPGLTESTGVLVRWETESGGDYDLHTPVVRWDGGAEQLVAAEHLAIA